jgi:chemotaxis protein methyltransferase CheR
MQNAKDENHSYTKFFRSPLQMEVLLDQIAHLVDAHQYEKLTIYVFAASNGSEVYTLAAELLTSLPALEFEILGSDHQQSLIDKAACGIYSFDEIYSHNFDSRRCEGLFIKKDDGYHVRPEIKGRCIFRKIDILSDDLSKSLSKADVIFAQNVFCHMDAHDVRRAFANIMHCLKSNGIMAICGMGLDLRVELTKKYGLDPVRTKVRAIHQEARQHIPEKWWRYYWGIEPYRIFCTDKMRRYSTIFVDQPFHGEVRAQ